MNKDVQAYTIEKTKEMINAHSCSSEAKAAGEKWLAAVGTEAEAAETKSYIQELEADIIPIDRLIAFAGSDAGAQAFGAELAEKIEAHGKEIKAAGAVYCDCPACAAANAILSRKEELL